MIEKPRLLAHDAARDAQHGIGARFEALDQPACFLQVATQVAGIVTFGLRDHALVMPVDGQRGAASGKCNPPDAIVAPGHAIRADVLRGWWRNLCAWLDRKSTRLNSSH